MFNDVHTEGAHFEMGNHPVELRETWEAKEDVDDVGGKLRAFLPVLTQHTSQGSDNGF